MNLADAGIAKAKIAPSNDHFSGGGSISLPPQITV
jgi:hypothetical protein